MFCNQCGNKLAEGSKFCNVCGAPVIMENSTENSVEEPAKTIIKENHTNTSKKRLNFSKKTILLLGIGIVSVVIVVLVLLLLRKSSSNLPVIYSDGDVYPITLKEGIQGLTENQTGVFLNNQFYTFDGMIYDLADERIFNELIPGGESGIGNWVQKSAMIDLDIYVYSSNLGRCAAVFISSPIKHDYYYPIMLPFSGDTDISVMEDVWRYYETRGDLLAYEGDYGALIYEQSMEAIWDYLDDAGYLLLRETEDSYGVYEDEYGEHAVCVYISNNEYGALYTEDGLFDFNDPDFLESDYYHEYEENDQTNSSLFKAASDYLINLVLNNECDIVVTVFFDSDQGCDYIGDSDSWEEYQQRENYVVYGEIQPGLIIYTSPEHVVEWADGWCPSGTLTEAVEECLENNQIPLDY